MMTRKRFRMELQKKMAIELSSGQCSLSGLAKGNGFQYKCFPNRGIKIDLGTDELQKNEMLSNKLKE